MTFSRASLNQAISLKLVDIDQASGMHRGLFALTQLAGAGGFIGAVLIAPLAIEVGAIAGAAGLAFYGISQLMQTKRTGHFLPLPGVPLSAEQLGYIPSSIAARLMGGEKPAAPAEVRILPADWLPQRERRVNFLLTHCADLLIGAAETAQEGISFAAIVDTAVRASEYAITDEQISNPVLSPTMAGDVRALLQGDTSKLMAQQQQAIAAEWNRAQAEHEAGVICDSEFKAIEAEVRAIAPDVVSGLLLEPAPIEAEEMPAAAARNLSKLMAKQLKSTLLLGAPRAGKGYATAKAIELLPSNVDVWVIDPKDDPQESHYWQSIPKNQRVHFDVTEIEAEDAIAQVEALFALWLQSHSTAAQPKLLIIDEAAPGLSTCGSKWFSGLMERCARLASVGPSKGKFVWILSQSSTGKDLGISNANKGGYRVVAVGHRDTAPAWYSSIANSLRMDKPPADLLAGAAYIQNDGSSWGASEAIELSARADTHQPWSAGEQSVIDVEPVASAAPVAPAQLSRWEKFRTQSADHPHLVALANWLERREGQSFTVRSLKKDKTVSAAFKDADADILAGLNTFARYGFVSRIAEGEYQIGTLP